MVGISLVLNVVRNRSNAMPLYNQPMTVTATTRRGLRKKIYVNRSSQAENG